MKLSVVIPVYGVEATLDRCVESVVGQDVADMEVILVDDGSPDGCPAMCDEWAAKDSRITVVHKQNGGLSDARNAGIDVASGDLITFVDSDDYLAPDTYGPLMARMKAEAACDLLEFSIAGRLQLTEGSFDNTERYWTETKAYAHTYAWNKIYRQTLFDGVRYPVGKIFEDVYTLPLLLRKARRVLTTRHGYYYYTDNQQGITATAGGQGLTQLLDAHLTSGMPMDDAYYMYLLNIQMDVWERTGAPIKLPHRQIRTQELTLKKRLKAITLNTIGIKRLCILNKLLHKVKAPNRW